MSRLIEVLARIQLEALARIQRFVSHKTSRQSRLRKLAFENVEHRRLLYSGEFDIQFGSNGVVKTDIDASTNWSHSAFDSAIQSDGNLLAVGDGGLARFLNDGSIDPLFGVAGRVSLPFNAKSIVLQPDGKIMVAGNTFVQGDFGVARFLANGNLDTSFHQDGVAIVDFAPREAALNDIAILPDGKLVLVGTSIETVVIVRLLSNGMLDSSFDGDGRKYFKATQGDSAKAIAVTTGGKFLVLGQGYSAESIYNRDIYVAQFLANGDFDNSFDGDGIKIIAVGKGKGGRSLLTPFFRCPLFSAFFPFRCGLRQIVGT